MPDRAVTELIWQALALAGRAPAGRLAGSLPPESLFRVLRESDDETQRSAAEDTVWSHWCSHEHADAEAAMERVADAIEAHRLDRALKLLDRLVAERPLWAEAWNKRAVVHFLLDHDADSAADIRRTLELEPRHFGALAGLGQLALRAGDEGAALRAFEQALALNPNLDELREAVELLRERRRPSLH